MSTEPTITTRSLPLGYSYVPKGNVFITGNCRKSTQEAQQKVYLVVSPGKDKKSLGIAVPTPIYDDVRAREQETRSERAAAVDKRDDSIKAAFEKAIQKEYPRIPAESMEKVLKTALQKRKGKVGRTGTLDIELKARLAVRAHIRHCHTLYDTHLRTKEMNQAEAREAIKGQVEAVALAWGKAPAARNKATKKGRKATKKNKRSKMKANKSTKVEVTAQKEDRRTVKAIAQDKSLDVIDLTDDKDEPEPAAKRTTPKAARPKPRREVSRSLSTRAITRSRQSISESMSELALRLPDDADHLVRLRHRFHG